MLLHTAFHLKSTKQIFYPQHSKRAGIIPRPLFYFRISCLRAQRLRPPPQYRYSGQFLQLPLGGFLSLERKHPSKTRQTITPRKTRILFIKRPPVLRGSVRSHRSFHCSFHCRHYCRGSRCIFCPSSFHSRYIRLHRPGSGQ